MTRQSEDIEAFKKLAEDWNAGWLASDTDALLNLYADAPVLMPQDQKAVVGKTAIRSLYQSIYEDYTVRGKGELIEAEVSGDLGYFWIAHTLTAIPKAGGKPIEGEGKSVFIVRRQHDDSWKITRLIDNSDRASTSNS